MLVYTIGQIFGYECVLFCVAYFGTGSNRDTRESHVDKKPAHTTSVPFRLGGKSAQNPPPYRNGEGSCNGS